MIYTNQLMSDFLVSNKENILKGSLDKSLQSLLDEGFLKISDCIFITEIYPPNYPKYIIKEKDIKEIFTDFSGFEVSTNKLHIEDFTDKDPFIQSITFAKEFKKKLVSSFPFDDFTMVIGFQNDEVGKFATFTFHKNRINEEVYDYKNLEVYDEPIYLEVICCGRI